MPGAHDSGHSYTLRSLAWVLSLVVLAGCQNIRKVRTEDAAEALLARKPLTVMSFNIRVGYGGKDPGVDPYLLAMKSENLPPILAAIRSIDPDIIGLQEARGADQVRRLAQALDMYYAYAWHDTDDSRPRWWGVAILSKYPILKSRRVQIESESGNVKSALICTADINGQSVAIFSIHTARDVKDLSSFKGLMKAVDKIDVPIILIGDLNMEPFDPRLQLLQPRFVDSAGAVDTESAKTARTTGTFLGVGRIDYVLVDRRYFEVQDAGIVASEHWAASDHIAYYTQILLKPIP